MSRKRVKDFELTLSQSTLSKLHVYFSLEEFCSKLLVAEEYHSDGGRHFHCYLHVITKTTIADLRLLLESNLFVDEESYDSIHLSSIRNAKHWIKYCTKEDVSPMYKNIDSGLFHQSYRIHEFVVHNQTFNRMHAFVRQNPSLMNIIEKMHADYWNKKQMQNWSQITAPVIPDTTTHWVRWADLNYSLRHHIYLYGPTGTGKTTWVNTIVRNNPGVVHLPCGESMFEFSDVDSTTSLIVAGDAPAGYLNRYRSTFLQLADKGAVSINVKCGPIRRIVANATLIIVSNYPPPEDEALRRRFIIVEADDYGVCPAPIPKIEVPEEVLETISISSDDTSSLPPVPWQNSPLETISGLCSNNDWHLIE